jgi:hypothetical protein
MQDTVFSLRRFMRITSVAHFNAIRARSVFSRGGEGEMLRLIDIGLSSDAGRWTRIVSVSLLGMTLITTSALAQRKEEAP